MVAVTGANGLLGSFIIRQLISEHIPFIALKRRGSDISLLDDVADSITWRDADVLNFIELEEALNNVTHVIHAAAIVSYDPRKADLLMDINVIGTRHVVNACLSRGIKRLVHISSVAALGRQKNQRIINETNQWIDSPLHTAYAKSKYLAELEVFRGQEEGLSTLIVNPSVILAPADWEKSSARIFKYVSDEKKFFADATLNYVDVRDVAAITVRLLHDESIFSERFIVNAGKIRIKTLFEGIARRLNRRPPSIKLNPTLLRMLARIEGWRSTLFGGEPLITRETARLAGADFIYENTKIINTLPFEFQPIDASLDWCCAYYAKKNLVKK